MRGFLGSPAMTPAESSHPGFPRFSSGFPPADARLRGTGGDTRGRPGMLGGRWCSLWPTGGDEGYYERKERDIMVRSVKIVDIAYIGSNPVAATLPLTFANAVRSWGCIPRWGMRGFPPFSLQTMPNWQAHPGALLRLVNSRMLKPRCRSGVRSPQPARRTRPPAAGRQAHRPPTRSCLAGRFGRTRALRRSRWCCDPA